MTRDADGQKVKSLIRGLGVLDLILDGGQALSVKQIMNILDIPRATAFEIVRVLEQRGYLSRDDEDRTYEIGRQLFRLGVAYQDGSDVWQKARHILPHLASETGETVQLSVLDRDKNLVVLRESRPTRIRFMFQLGVRTPINWSASGCLLISDYSDAELRARLDGELPPSPTGRAPTSIESVVEEIRCFRSQGYGIKLGHVHDDVGMIAAPVFGSGGRLEAAVTIVAQNYGAGETRRRELLLKAQRAADDLSNRLSA